LPIKGGSGSRFVLVGGGFAGVIFGSSRNILPVVFPHMRSTVQMNYQDLGILTSSYFFSYMIFSFIWGHYSDKIGGGKIVLLGSLICGLMIIGMGFSNHFISAVLFSIAIGIGAGGIRVPMLSVLLKWFKDRKHGLSVSIHSAGEGIQALLVGIIIPLIIAYFSWRFVWWFFGMFSILLFLGLLALLKGSNSNREPKKSRYSEDDLNFFRIIRLPRMFRLSVIYFLQAITRGAFATFIVAYLIQEGISFKVASGAYSLMGLGLIPGTVLSGIASDLLRRIRVLTCLLFIQGISVSFILLIHKILPVYLFVGMVGFCLIGVTTVMATIPSEYFDRKVYGKIMGFLTLVYGIGVTLSPFIGGTLADWSGSLTLTLSVFGAGVSLLAGIIALLTK